MRCGFEAKTCADASNEIFIICATIFYSQVVICNRNGLSEQNFGCAQSEAECDAAKIFWQNGKIKRKPLLNERSTEKLTVVRRFYHAS